MTEKEKIFDEIAKEAAKDKGDNIDDFEYYSYYMCPDQYVGKIKNVIKKKRFWRKNIEETNAIEQYDKIIILILESPHQDEFESDKNVSRRFPIGPANGATGVNIWKFLNSIFSQKISDLGDCALLLMNAIPFQCSLGLNLSNNETNKKTRDAVFNAVWDDKNIGANFFERRLENLLDALLRKNVVIVNACTQGTQKSKPLCCQVCKSIINVIQNYCDDEKSVESPVAFYHIHHPSSWTYGNTTLNKDKTSISKESNDFNCKEDKNLEKCYGKIKYNIE